MFLFGILIFDSFTCATKLSNIFVFDPTFQKLKANAEQEFLKIL